MEWDSRCGIGIGQGVVFIDMGGMMLPLVVPAGTAKEGETLEALIGLVKGGISGNGGMPPVVVAVGKATRGFNHGKP